ncbi:MFS transporter [Oceanibacterium hippocampi]|uniref:Major Facilitator Superfamily protein n=1 Tax=Oceanibacterium hippocampi TaxID=745714 RepID=A0A1Y5TB57_9PROT|nr:MFS transporter [Oceanibacterium hippocampi]SLN59762.1 Major Facilitator Superfamily protein [Oceanibacterium hippocampi]
MLNIDFIRSNLRWLGAGFLLSFSSSFGQTYFISLFSGDLRDLFGLSHGEFGGLYTIATLSSAATLVWLGKLADSQPLARLASMTIVGLALAAIAMASVFSPIMLVVVFYALRLLGQGMLSHLAFTAMGRWYRAQRGQAIAIAAMGFPAGEALFPIVAVALVAWIGWRETWLVAAGVLLAVLLPAMLLLLSRGRTPKGYRADGGDDDGTAPRDWTRGEVLRDPLFYALMPGLLAPPFILTGVIFNQVHLVEVKGWSLAAFAVAYPAYSLAAVSASLLYGIATDRWGSGRLLPVYLLPLASALVLLAFGTAPWTPLAFMALSGFTAGAATTLLGALWAEIYGTRHLGAIRALAVASMVFATGVAPGMMGALIDLGIDITDQILAMAGYTLAAALLFLGLNMATPRLTRTAA